MAKLVSKVYGDALFELAIEENKLDTKDIVIACKFANYSSYRIYHQKNMKQKIDF